MDIITSYYLKEKIKKKELLLEVINQEEKKYDCKVISYFKSCEKCGQDNYSCQCLHNRERKHQISKSTITL